MKKYVTLVRHAKAKSSAKYDQDDQRPLTGKGRKQIKRIAPVLARAKAAPDWIVSSPARRAQQTAQLLADALGYEETIHWDDRIYAASATTLLDVLRDMPDVAQHVVLVGHNPGMEDLVSGLCSGTESRLNLRLSTAGVAHLQPEIYHWHQLRWGCGRLRFLVAPRYLKR